MRRFALTVPVVAVVAIALVSGILATQSASAREPLPLQLASQQLSKWDYSLTSLTHCEVSDGISVVKDVAATSIRITGVRTVVAGGTGMAKLPWTYQLMSFREGSTTGELAGSIALTALRNGRALGRAIGSQLAPITRSGSWYDIVGRVRLPARESPAWQIRGINVSYEQGAHHYTTLFRQAIRLTARHGCA